MDELDETTQGCTDIPKVSCNKIRECSSFFELQYIIAESFAYNLKLQRRFKREILIACSVLKLRKLRFN